MRIDVLYFDGWPNHERLLDHLPCLLAREGFDAEIALRKVSDPEHAQRERFLGSPTIRVNGGDVDPSAAGRTDYGLKCRLHQTPEGLTGLPPRRMDPRRTHLTAQLASCGSRAHCASLIGAGRMLVPSEKQVALPVAQSVTLGSPCHASAFVGAPFSDRRRAATRVCANRIRALPRTRVVLACSFCWSGV